MDQDGRENGDAAREHPGGEKKELHRLTRYSPHYRRATLSALPRRNSCSTTSSGREVSIRTYSTSRRRQISRNSLVNRSTSLRYASTTRLGCVISSASPSRPTNRHVPSN